MQRRGGDGGGGGAPRVSRVGPAVSIEAVVEDALAATHWLFEHGADHGLAMERVVLTVREHGNTSAASVPMALDTAIRDGRIKRGDLLLLEAFGGGFTWASVVVRW